MRLPSAPPRTDASALSLAVQKLIGVIEEENRILAEHRIVFHGGFTERKNQSLRELIALQRCGDFSQAALFCGEELRTLADLLRINSSLLKVHIGAVGEISDIIISGLRSAESDGTYSRSFNLRS